MTKTIILVRHGETEKDKNNPNRKLTLLGKLQIQKTAEELNALIKESDGIIITTKTKRTRMAARILAKVLNFKIKQTQLNLRVDNFDQIERTYPKSKNIVFSYFKDFENNCLPSEVPFPTEVAKTFLKIVGPIEKDVIIFVGHGAALESFALFQEVYKPIKPLKEDLGYGKFIVLESN